MYPRYSFKGMIPFIEDAARYLGIVPHSISVAKVQSLWHVKRLQDALGQAKLDYTQVQLRETMAYIGDIRHGLAVALAGADAAILEVCQELEIPLPDYLKDDAEPANGKPEPEKATISQREPASRPGKR